MEWQAIRLSGQDALAVRASKRLVHDELLLTRFAGTRLRMDLDKVPLWRGDRATTSPSGSCWRTSPGTSTCPA